MSIVPCAHVGDLCFVTAGGTPSRSNPAYWNGDIPWVKISDLLQGVITDTEERISDVGLRNSAAKLLPKGTLLLSIFATIGRTAVLDIDAATNQAIVGLSIKDHERLDRNYFRCFLRFKSAELEQRARGVAQLNINGAILKSIEVPLPPLHLQRRIADILDRADALRAKRRAALAKLEKLTQAIFLDMFGDPATNPKAWATHPLEALISTGPQNGLYRPSSAYGSGTSILRIDGFYDGKVTDLSSLKRVRLSEKERELFALREGEVVINRVNSRQYLGKSAIVPTLSEPTVYESNMMRFDVFRDRLLPTFLIAYMQTSFVREHFLRAAKDAINQSSINQQDVKAIPILLPSLGEQNRFVARTASVEHLVDVNREAVVALDALFASLQHRAFRGDL